MIEQICLDELLLDAAKEVFNTMIFMSIEKSGHSTQDTNDDTILGSITFQGNMEGCLALTYNMPCAKSVAANMLAMEPDEQISNAEIADAIGEVTNMIMGSLKSRLQKSVGEINVSIPTVVTGKQLENNLGDGTEKVYISVSIQDQYDAEFSLLYRENRNNS